MKRLVSETDIKKRLDVFVVEQFPLLSRAFGQKLIDEGRVLVNKAMEKPGYKLRAQDVVTIDYDQKELGKIPEIDIPVIYEDEDCVVINKPTGLLTHSKGAFNPEATVATWLRNHLQTDFARSNLAKVDQQRMGIVHRLDRGTSGVMICAKNPVAMAWLQKQFSARRVKKSYIAIVTGVIEPKEAVIDMPIERNPKKPQTFRVGANGKEAKTHYRVLGTIAGQASDYSVVELKPETGRTHQLRVHLKQLEHPIVGDTFYDGEPAKRLFLHAQSLEITLPSRERMRFEAQTPTEFKKFSGQET